MLIVVVTKYKPSNKNYPGDEQFQDSTQIPRARRALQFNSNDDDTTVTSAGSSGVLIRDLVNESTAVRRNHRPRLCGYLDNFEEHPKSAICSLSNHGICQVCRIICFSKCGICNKYMHFFPIRGEQREQTCFIRYHNENFLGLARGDSYLHGKAQRRWVAPTKREMDNNKKHIKKLRRLQERESRNM